MENENKNEIVENKKSEKGNNKSEKKEKKGGFKFSNKAKLFTAIAALTGLSTAAVFAAKEIYDSFFPRYERPDYSVYPSCYNYETYKERLARKTFYFHSGDVKLKGYLYEAKNSKGVIVLVHGLHAGADDYLPIAEYMVNGGYSVFSYDGTGMYDSEGDSTVGMCQSLVDLDNALTYVKNTDYFQGKPLFLIGHSCGGYAVSSVLAIKKNLSIKAALCIAAVNDCFTLIIDKGKEYAGELAGKGIPKIFLDTYQKILFRQYVNYNGVKGINSTDIPVIVAHGENDKIISFDGQSITAKRSEIINPNVSYYITRGLQGGHDTLWHSERSAAYTEKVKADLKIMKEKVGRELTHEEKAEYYKTLDGALYGEVNEELFDLAIKTFDKTLN